MARTKTDDMILNTLGRYRSELLRQSEEFPASAADLMAEIENAEAHMKKIDPAILTLKEEAKLVLDGSSAEAVDISQDDVLKLDEAGGLSEAVEVPASPSLFSKVLTALGLK